MVRYLSFTALAALAALAAAGCNPVIMQSPPVAYSAPAQPTAIPVFPKGRGPDQVSNIVAVLDFHSSADTENKGFDELRARAMAVGADAVIDAEFEHGEGGQLSHLSGLAVRFKVYDARAYDVIEQIVIETDGVANDKGFSALRARALQLGADKLVDVKFEHGEGGAPSRLIGTAVRYRR